MRRHPSCLAALCLALTTGCYTVRYSTGAPGGGGRHELPAHFFLLGLVGERVVDLDALCPSGVARWYNQATFTDGFLSVLTLGIFTPRTIVVECSTGSAWQVAPVDGGRVVVQAQLASGGVP